MSNGKQAILSRRQILSGSAGVSAAGAVLLAAYSTTQKARHTGSAIKPPVPVAGGVVYLTFDDGPTPGYTDKVLAHLKAAGACATFFQVGRRMMGNQALVKQILADGHQIGTHSWSHPDFTQLGQPARTLDRFGAETKKQIVRARNLQAAYTEGYDSGLFRYPHFHRTNYGDILSSCGRIGPRCEPIETSPSNATESAIRAAYSAVGGRCRPRRS